MTQISDDIITAFAATPNQQLIISGDSYAELGKITLKTSYL